MKTIAKVVAVNGSRATVETVRVSACEGCHKNAEGEGCSVCSLLGGEQKMQAVAENPCRAEVGDTVSIESDTKRLLRYAALLFLLPIGIFFAGYGVASLFGAGESPAALGGIGGFSGSVLVLVGISASDFKKKTADIVITEILMHGKKQNEK